MCYTPIQEYSFGLTALVPSTAQPLSTAERPRMRHDASVQVGGLNSDSATRDAAATATHSNMFISTDAAFGLPSPPSSADFIAAVDNLARMLAILNSSGQVPYAMPDLSTFRMQGSRMYSQPHFPSQASVAPHPISSLHTTPSSTTSLTLPSEEDTEHELILQRVLAHDPSKTKDKERSCDGRVMTLTPALWPLGTLEAEQRSPLVSLKGAHEWMDSGSASEPSSPLVPRLQAIKKEKIASRKRHASVSSQSELSELSSSRNSSPGRFFFCASQQESN